METHTQRFSETPPGSPKSCMKGSRRINFEDESGSSAGPGNPTPPVASSSTHHHHHHSSSHHHREHGHSGGSSSKKSHFVSHESDAPPPQSPKTKRTVMIKSPGSEHTTTSTGVGTSSMSTQCAAEIPFQFHLSQHYDNPDPPPNCTSNGAYEEERLKKLSQQSPASPTSDSSDPSSSSSTVVSSQPSQQQKPESLYNNHSDKLQQYDPQLVAIASKFVNEIIQNATREVANKGQKTATDIKRGSTASTSTEHRHRDFFGIGRTPWYRRAHGVISKWVTNICVRAQNAMKT